MARLLSVYGGHGAVQQRQSLLEPAQFTENPRQGHRSVMTRRRAAEPIPQDGDRPLALPFGEQQGRPREISTLRAQALQLRQQRPRPFEITQLDARPKSALLESSVGVRVARRDDRAGSDRRAGGLGWLCLLYTSDAADE